MSKEWYCKHYNDGCSVGVKPKDLMELTDGWVKRLPCDSENKTDVICKKFKFKTRKELEEEELAANHPLFKKIHVTMRFEQWLVNDISDIIENEGVNRTKIAQNAVIKQHKFKRPTKKDLEKYNESKLY